MWATSQQLRSEQETRGGFTIVELLIVIVVIGILAAITIVAYNGIQQRARVATLQSDLEGVAKTLEASKVLSGTDQYPADLAAAGLKASSGDSYQYTVNNNTASPPSYCVTGTIGTTSYWVSSTGNAPTNGGCPGHGVGGIAAITNLVVNPSAETSPSGWLYRTNSTVATSASSPIIGSQSVLMTATGAGASVTSSAVAGPYPIAATPGTTYTASMSFRPLDVASQLKLVIDWYNGPTYISSSPGSISASTSVGSVAQMNASGIAPASATRLQIYALVNGGVSGNRWLLDGAMVTSGSTVYNYADGSSPNWVWNGTPNASTSTGPPQ